MLVKEDLRKLILFTLKVFIVLVLLVALPIFMIFMFGVFSFAMDGVEEDGDDLVYVVDLRGSIQEGAADFMDSGINPNQVDEKLRSIEEVQGAEAVVLRVDSPGGSIAASQEIASIIDNYDLPVVISMGDAAASGGYYISAPADHIVANRGTTTGSIGVISMIVNPQGLYEKLGIETEVITAGEYKDLGLDGLNEKERQLIQDRVDEFYEQFVESVSTYRDMDKDEVYELATGEVFSGEKAYELGLIDEVGGLKEAVKKAGELAGIEDPQKTRFESPGFLQSFIGITRELPGIIERIFAPDELEYYFKFEDELPVIFKYKYGM